MRSRSKLVVSAGILLTCTWSAACSGILGDFSESGDASAGPGSPDASFDATVASDAGTKPPGDAGPSQSDDGAAGDAQDLDAGDAADAAACGSKCAVALGANGTHTCAVMGDQSVVCWGDNSDGESGPAAHGNSTPTVVSGIGPARLVKASDTATCALLVDKSVWCWGSNARGTLGVPDASANADGGVPPVEVFPPGAVADLAMGAYHACVLTTATPPAVMCWGGNQSGQAGVADAAVVPLPTALAITDVGALGASAFATCFARTTSPEGECIGENTYGELGRGAADDGGIDDLPHPVPAAADIGTFGGVRDFYHSTGYHVGALFTSGNIVLWGDNNDGQLGPQNDSGAPDPTPAIVNLDEVTALAMTQYATCALRVDGSVWCWGSTADGQTGSTANVGQVQVSPVQVAGLADGGASLLTTGLTHVCALVQGGNVECWGLNNVGQLGRSTSDEFDPVPAPVVF